MIHKLARALAVTSVMSVAGTVLFARETAAPAPPLERTTAPIPVAAPPPGARAPARVVTDEVVAQMQSLERWTREGMLLTTSPGSASVALPAIAIGRAPMVR